MVRRVKYVMRKEKITYQHPAPDPWSSQKPLWYAEKSTHVVKKGENVPDTQATTWSEFVAQVELSPQVNGSAGYKRKYYYTNPQESSFIIKYR